jgi:hypothetical protein
MKTGMHVQRAAIRKPNRVSDGDWASRQAKPSQAKRGAIVRLTPLRFLMKYNTQRGAARAREPALLAERSQDGEARAASSERMPRWHPRASGDGARAAPRHAIHCGARGEPNDKNPR